MSELTRCNYCSLQQIKRDAAARGATVTTRMETPQERTFNGTIHDAWVVVEVSDREQPVAKFMALTTHCVC